MAKVLKGTMKRRLFLLGLFVCVFVPFCLAPAANAADVIKWKLQTPYPAGSLEHKTTGELFCNLVKEMSGGRLLITPYPAGALVGTFEVLDSVKAGLINATTVWSFYFMRKDPGLAMSIGMPYGLDARDAQAWLDNYGGIELLREIMGNLGVSYVDAVSPHVPGDYVQSIKRVNSVKELRGLKAREIGPAAETLTKLGVSVVSLPPGEIYTALERGTIDFVSFASMGTNYRFQFHEVAKYLYLPGLGDSWISEIMVNNKSWEKLPPDLKAIVKTAFRAAHLAWQSAATFEEHKIYKELKKQGCEIIEWSAEDMKLVKEADLKTWQEYAGGKAGETGKKIAGSKLEYCKEIGFIK